MSKYIFIAVSVAVLTLSSNLVYAQRGVSQQWQREAAEFGWQFDYQKARRQAAAEKKPMMVVFRCIP